MDDHIYGLQTELLYDQLDAPVARACIVTKLNSGTGRVGQFGDFFLITGSQRI